MSDGPYYLSNYTKGQGSVLKANPFWAGKKPAINEVDFKLITDTNSEEEAMRGGEVDAISPTFGLYLQPLKSTPGITFNQIPGYYFEHIEFREGNAKAGDSVNAGASNKLLLTPWFREAIAMSIDRQSIINTVYGALAGNTKPMNNAIYYSDRGAVQAGLREVELQPAEGSRPAWRSTARAVPLRSIRATRRSGRARACRRASTGRGRRVTRVRATSEAIAKAEAKAIGIQINDHPVPANVIFGSTGLPSGNFDVAEFAEITTGDPGDWYDSWRCQGAGNWTGYCSHEGRQPAEGGQRGARSREARRSTSRRRTPSCRTRSRCSRSISGRPR